MDLRVKRTLREIENSFIDLVISIGFDKVTVIQIAKNAEINPKTFYDHFQDKYDLAKHIGDKFIEEYFEIVQNHFKSIETNSDADRDAVVSIVKSMINDNSLRKSFLALQMIKVEDIDINLEMKKMIAGALNSRHVSNDPLVIELMAVIVLKAISYYIQNPETFSVEHQLEVIKELRAILGSFSE
ncbi:TetR/AcrR family transcriptional regulator [Lactobacillus sp. Sy-1]|uniref:TetR/AcrR family transcriptional regulator n=1 Tax=Lactobacillus sp. Sy-1 TaxID=2109645 RepID=UPI001C58FE0E|nr:TetR family transcriptional regulator [Lactobacillus sp. Sy-1]MBW1605061.1 TetR family transcriptional regulator [Lactobacillus sp. Sy-1]